MKPTAKKTSPPAKQKTEQPPPPKVASQTASEKKGTAAKNRTADTPPEEPAPPEPICRMLIYLPEGPLVLDMSISVHGKSLGAINEELIEYYTHGLDTEQAGFVTWDQAFAARGMQPMPAQPGRDIGQEERDALKRQYDLNHNDRVDRAEAEVYVRGRHDIGAGLDLLDDGSTDQGAGTVWRLLDTDGNLVLSADELAHAPAQLKTLDADDNDVLQLEELDRNRALSASRGDSADAAGTLGPPRVAMLGVAAPWDSILYALQNRYQQDNRLVVDQYPLAKPLLVLDKFTNNRLDRSEIEGLNTVEPQLRLRLAFGAATGDEESSPEASLSIEHKSDLLPTEVRIAGDNAGRPTIDLPDIGLRFTLIDVVPNDFAAVAKQQLAALDGDANGYLEEDELPEGALPISFAMLDANDDGKVYPDELVPYLQRQFATQSGRINVRTTSRSDATFAALDTDRDGQLSLRETLNAAARLRELAGGEQSVTLDRLPHFLNLEFSTQGTAAASMARPERRGPRWFVRMDSNSDGDISPREFLGTAEQFARLDSNADGFIDPDEATKAP